MTKWLTPHLLNLPKRAKPLKKFSRVHDLYEYQVLDAVLILLSEPQFEDLLAAYLEKMQWES